MATDSKSGEKVSGQGFTAEVKGGDILLIAVDLKAPGALSASQKSVVLASTHGNITVAGGKLGLNFYRPKAA